MSSDAFTETQAARIRIAMDKQLTDAALTRETQDIADDLEEEFENFGDQIRAAKERHSGRKEDLIVARLKDRNGIKETAKQQAEEALLDTNVALAMSGNLTHLEALDAGLTAPGLAAVNRVIDQFQGARALPSGSDRYWELRRESENPGTRETFKDRDLNLDAALVTPEELDELKKLQLASDKGALETYVQKVDRALAGLQLPRTTEQIAKAAEARSTKIKPEQTKAFRRAIHAEKLRREEKLGRRLTGDEIDEVIDFGIETIVLDSPFLTFGGTERARFAILPRNVEDVDLDEIPSDHMKQVRDELKEFGNNDPTPEEIRKAYVDLLRGGFPFSEIQ